MTDVAINKDATQLLWEGTNPKGEVRKVYYVQYEDGHCILLKTDADGNTVSYWDAQRICTRYIPWKYASEQENDLLRPKTDFGE